MNKKVGRALYLIRTELGLEQSDIARSLKCSQANYSRMESGKQAISVEALVRIAEILGVTPGGILTLALAVDREIKAVDANW